ncbi:hypothetical protein Agabi119p4_6746 [Agaricus bisporus var. burnettii]|uniref:Uncharacterized protein n=1 Tax=Agaricus bisporus var. burnettii TaxID=192524 RepID=A0A8H7C8Z3_AGABI|nr:hypothetical protein Agabi119p4_6746 [Agaricus bisporus var. burnettii]
MNNSLYERGKIGKVKEIVHKRDKKDSAAAIRHLRRAYDYVDEDSDDDDDDDDDGDDVDGDGFGGLQVDNCNVNVGRSVLRKRVQRVPWSPRRSDQMDGSRAWRCQKQ